MEVTTYKAFVDEVTDIEKTALSLKHHGLTKLGDAEIIRPPFGGSNFEKNVFKIKQRVKHMDILNRKKQKAARDALRTVKGNAISPSELSRMIPLPTQVAMGAIAAGLSSSAHVSMLSEKEKKQRLEKGGPITRFSLKNPMLYGGAVGGVTLPLVLSRKTFPGAIAASFAPAAGLYALDKYLKHREQRDSGSKSRNEVQ